MNDFSVSSNTVVEGDVVEVRWNCNDAAEVSLTIDNGYKTSTLPLEASGVKKFRLNRSKGRTRLILHWTQNGKAKSDTLHVKVKPLATTKAEFVDDKGRRLDGVMGWWNRMKNMFADAFLSGPHKMTPAKRLAFRLVVAMVVVLLLSLFTGWLTPLLISLIVVYLLMYLIRPNEN